MGGRQFTQKKKKNRPITNGSLYQLATHAWNYGLGGGGFPIGIGSLSSSLCGSTMSSAQLARPRAIMANRYLNAFIFFYVLNWTWLCLTAKAMRHSRAAC